MRANAKQDRAPIRTFEQLIRRYDLESIASIQRATENVTIGLNKTNATLEEFVIATIGTLENMQSQIDGNISTWFYKGEPTLDTVPANEWTTFEERHAHAGDLYYDKDTGYGYRFTETDGSFAWDKIKDNDVVEALAIANAAQDTADGKRRVFTDTPSPPYDVGDLWFKEKEIYICNTAKPEGGKYESGDFGIATKYTGDERANEVADDLAKNYSTTVEMNSAILKSSEEILVSIAATYTTKNELTNEIKALEEQYTAVSLKADGLETTVKSHTTQIGNLTTRVTSAESSITQHAKEIDLRVKSDSIIAAINLSPETALIAAKHIDLVGAVTFSSFDSSAQSKINTASTNASNAVSTANTASTNASNAVSTANTAKTTADSAASDASSALTKANTAVTTANTASTNANTAVSTANTANTNATNALNRATYHYGTCGTAAATAAKVVTLSGFSLYTGAMVSVYFTYANTAASPTLNVNGTGAKSIRVNNAVITAKYYWRAGDTVSFVYNGTYWVLADTSANSLLASWCSDNDRTLIDGGKIYASEAFLQNIFSKNITATGTISGVTLESKSDTTDGSLTISSGVLRLYDKWGGEFFRSSKSGEMQWLLPLYNDTGELYGSTNMLQLNSGLAEDYYGVGTCLHLGLNSSECMKIGIAGAYAVASPYVEINAAGEKDVILYGPLSALHIDCTNIICTDVRIRNGISLSELNSNLGIVVESLRLATTITTTETTFSTYNGRRFSDYAAIFFTAGPSASDMRLQIMIPGTIFTGNPNFQYVVQGNSDTNGSLFNQVVFKYVSDTSVNIKLTMGVMNNVYIWGMRLKK